MSPTMDPKHRVKPQLPVAPGNNLSRKAAPGPPGVSAEA